MFDNRWDNWAGDFTDSFWVGQLDPSVRNFVPEILAQFGIAVRKIDRDFPDEVSVGTFATVLTDVMPRLSLPDSARPQIPEVIARFLEYLQESGRVGEGFDWASQIRIIGKNFGKRLKPEVGVKGVTIRRPEDASPLGRNDPCPCGSGEKIQEVLLRAILKTRRGGNLPWEIPAPLASQWSSRV